MHHFNKGFSLVELMVTLVLGLIISAAAVQLYLTSQTTTSQQQAVTQAQEKGRFVMDLLINDIRKAGQYPDNPNVSTPSGVLIGKPSIVAPVFASTSPAVSDTDPTTNSTAFAVSYIYDNSVGNATDCNGYGYSSPFPSIINIYYVAPSTGSSTDNSIWCKGNGNLPTGVTSQAQELLRGVDFMQVMYGIDNLADNILSPTQWTTSPSGALASQPVVGARIAFLTHSDITIANQPAPPSGGIRVLGCSVPSTNCSAATNLQDGRVRRVFVGTTLLRNNLYQSATF